MSYLHVHVAASFITLQSNIWPNFHNISSCEQMFVEKRRYITSSCIKILEKSTSLNGEHT